MKLSVLVALLSLQVQCGQGWPLPIVGLPILSVEAAVHTEQATKQTTDQSNREKGEKGEQLYQAIQIAFSARLDDDQLETIAKSDGLKTLLAEAVSETLYDHLSRHRPYNDQEDISRVEDLTVVSLMKREKFPALESAKGIFNVVDIKLKGHISLGPDHLELVKFVDSSTFGSNLGKTMLQMDFDDSLDKANAARLALKKKHAGDEGGRQDHTVRKDGTCSPGSSSNSSGVGGSSKEKAKAQKTAKVEQVQKKAKEYGMIVKVPLLLPPPASLHRILVTNSILQACRALRQPLDETGQNSTTGASATAQQSKGGVRKAFSGSVQVLLASLMNETFKNVSSLMPYEASVAYLKITGASCRPPALLSSLLKRQKRQQKAAARLARSRGQASGNATGANGTEEAGVDIDEESWRGVSPATASYHQRTTTTSVTISTILSSAVATRSALEGAVGDLTSDGVFLMDLAKGLSRLWKEQVEVKKSKESANAAVVADSAADTGGEDGEKSEKSEQSRRGGDVYKQVTLFFNVGLNRQQMHALYKSEELQTGLVRAAAQMLLESCRWNDQGRANQNDDQGAPIRCPDELKGIDTVFKELRISRLRLNAKETEKQKQLHDNSLGHDEKDGEGWEEEFKREWEDASLTSSAKLVAKDARLVQVTLSGLMLDNVNHQAMVSFVRSSHFAPALSENMLRLLDELVAETSADKSKDTTRTQSPTAAAAADKAEGGSKNGKATADKENEGKGAEPETKSERYRECSAQAEHDLQTMFDELESLRGQLDEAKTREDTFVFGVRSSVLVLVACLVTILVAAAIGGEVVRLLAAASSSPRDVLVQYRRLAKAVANVPVGAERDGETRRKGVSTKASVSTQTTKPASSDGSQSNSKSKKKNKEDNLKNAAEKKQQEQAKRDAIAAAVNSAIARKEHEHAAAIELQVTAAVAQAVEGANKKTKSLEKAIAEAEAREAKLAAELEAQQEGAAAKERAREEEMDEKRAAKEAAMEKRRAKEEAAVKKKRAEKEAAVEKNLAEKEAAVEKKLAEKEAAVEKRRAEKEAAAEKKLAEEIEAANKAAAAEVEKARLDAKEEQCKQQKKWEQDLEQAKNEHKKALSDLQSKMEDRVRKEERAKVQKEMEQRMTAAAQQAAKHVADLTEKQQKQQQSLNQATKTKEKELEKLKWHVQELEQSKRVLTQKLEKSQSRNAYDDSVVRYAPAELLAMREASLKVCPPSSLRALIDATADADDKESADSSGDQEVEALKAAADLSGPLPRLTGLDGAPLALYTSPQEALLCPPPLPPRLDIPEESPTNSPRRQHSGRNKRSDQLRHSNSNDSDSGTRGGGRNSRGDREGKNNREKGNREKGSTPRDGNRRTMGRVGNSQQKSRKPSGSGREERNTGRQSDAAGKSGRESESQKEKEKEKEKSGNKDKEKGDNSSGSGSSGSGSSSSSSSSAGGGGGADENVPWRQAKGPQGAGFAPRQGGRGRGSFIQPPS